MSDSRGKENHLLVLKSNGQTRQLLAFWYRVVDQLFVLVHVPRIKPDSVRPIILNPPTIHASP